MSLAQLTRWCRERFPKSKAGERLLYRRTPSVKQAGVLNMTESGERRFDIPWMVLDATLCNKTWGWSAKTSVPSILEEIANHAESFPDWLSVSKQ
jgi:hypothetical protein